MEKEFSSISELAAALKEGVERMEQGGLSVRDLELLTREAAELYERLIILRYKAYDTIVKPEMGADSLKESNPIRITVPENQINLIDAIEEVENGDEPIEEASEGTPFRLDFGDELDVEQEDKLLEQVDEVEQEANIEVPEDVIEVLEDESEELVVEEVIQEPEIKLENEEPIALKEEEKKPEEKKLTVEEEEYIDNSLAAKLRKSPIQDLRKSIGLNQKFQFISELFDGDHQSYDALIESLNTAPSLENALSSLNDQQSKHEWESEGKTYLQLKELVERRHA